MLVVNIDATVVSEPLTDLRRSVDAWLHIRKLVLLYLLASSIAIEVHRLQAMRPPSQRFPLSIKVLQFSSYLLKLLHGLASFLDFFEG